MRSLPIWTAVGFAIIDHRAVRSVRTALKQHCRQAGKAIAGVHNFARQIASASYLTQFPAAPRDSRILSIAALRLPRRVPIMGQPISEEKRRMKSLLSTILSLALAAFPAMTNAADEKSTDRLQECGMVLTEIMNIPDGIPQNLIDKAECVIVIPSVLKAAFLVGGSYGRGAMSCRAGANFSGPWGAPSMMALEGGSFGFQLGGQATDFVILVMNPRGATSILKNKVKLGGDVSAAAGPKGRDAEADTDVTLRAEMLTYSRARGLFAGVSLEGSSLRPDNNLNEDLYGKKISAEDIVLNGAAPAPPAAELMLSTLEKHSPRNDSDPHSLK
jgi:SH3 domain-containing YSC84-like protein 1